jgi:hypothetical protein
MLVAVRHLLRGLVAILLLGGAWLSWSGPDDDRAARPVRSSPPSTTVPGGDPVRERAGVVVPIVTGLHNAFAQDLLRSRNLRPGSITLELSPHPWGSVVAQSIDAGATVAFGTTIDLVVARGAPPAPCWPDCQAGTHDVRHPRSDRRVVDTGRYPIPSARRASSRGR